MSGIPKWVSPSRQSHLVSLFDRSGGFCIFGHRPCQGTVSLTTAHICKWGLKCPKPNLGNLCYHKPEPEKPRLPCRYTVRQTLTWRCGYGERYCQGPWQAHYEQYAKALIREWVSDDRASVAAQWQAEEKGLHGLAERGPQRGQFNAVGRDIFYARQPTYYHAGLGISGLTFKPFAKIRLASSFMGLHVELGDTLRRVSKNKRRKAIRYGKPLPKAVANEIDNRCSEAVRRYQKR